jgi:ERCC4-type nuclease
MIQSLPELKTPKLPDASWKPTIIVDSREQTPLVFSFPSITAGLVTGDYSVKGLEDDFAVERKTLPDLFGSLTSGRKRFMRELQRMRAHPFRRLLIVGSENEIQRGSSRYHGINPESIMHSLHAVEARGVPVVFCSSPQAAALKIESWAFWRCREAFKMAKAMQSS